MGRRIVPLGASLDLDCPAHLWNVDSNPDGSHQPMRLTNSHTQFSLTYKMLVQGERYNGSGRGRNLEEQGL